MANISDVYEIEFVASSEELAIALLAYLKEIEKEPAEYNTTSEATRDGLTINGGYAAGRWVYSSNLEGTFERPHSWLGIQPGSDLEALHAKVYDLLKAGEMISFSYSEDEPGCEVYQDGAGNVEFHDGKVQVSIDFEEHDRPDCQMMPVLLADTEGRWYCEDHDHEQANEARYCEEVEV